MAEEILVREYLTDQMVAAGKELLQRLRATNFEVAAAFWLYFPEAGEWRLTLAWPQASSEGSKKAYTKIWDVLHQGSNRIRGLDLRNITVVGLDETLVRALASANNLTALSEKRLSGNRINGVYVEDIYIYFIEESIKPLPGPRWISK